MTSTLIHNVRIFDGEEVFSQNGYLLLGDGVIKSIGTEPGKLPAAEVVIDGEVCIFHKPLYLILTPNHPSSQSSKHS
jgi:cytosine/adenosine deaminase-related metal-dependent hydrolase